MSLGFNPTPTVGELHTAGTKTWRWNGVGWEVKAHLTPSPVPTPYQDLQFYNIRALSVYSANAAVRLSAIPR